MPIFFSPFFSSSTFPWNDISGALPWVDEPVNFGPFGQTSKSCFAFSEMQAAGAADPDPPDEAAAEDEDDAPCARRGLERTHNKRVLATTQFNATRFIPYLPHFDVIVWR
jgi:hypothetical protein